MTGKNCKEYGFSLIQLVVGFAISAIVLAIVANRFSVQRRVLAFENQKSDLRTSSEQIYQRIAKDLAKAVRITGFTSNTLSGISGRTANRASETENDPLTIYVEEHGQLSADIVSINPNQLQVEAAANTGITEAEFVRHVALNNDYFLLSNLNRTNLLTRLPNSATTWSPTSPELLTVLHANAADFTAQDFSETTRLRAASRIDYFVDSQNQLIRRRVMRVNSPRDEIVAQDVNLFQVDFSFRSQDPDSNRGVFNAPKKQNPISFPGSSAYVCTNPPVNQTCASWNDVEQIRVTLQIKDEIAPGLEKLVASTEEFIASQSELTFKTQAWITPYRYEIDQFSSQGSGQEVCRVNDSRTRCDADFSHCFTESSRASPKWKGFGDLQGPYCQCLGGSQNVPSTLTYNANTKDQLDQCAAAFNGCEDNWLKAIHPGIQLACMCLHKGENDNQPNVYYNKGYDPGLHYEVYDFKQASKMPKQASDLAIVMTSQSPSGNPEAIPPNEVACKYYQNIDNQVPVSCDSAAQQYFDVAWGNSNAVTTWADHCGCLTHDIDALGNPRWDIEIMGRAKNLGRLCGLTGFNRCDNTRNSDGRYILSDQNTNTHIQGLSQTDAALCDCLDDAGLAPTDLNRGVWNQTWDLRSPRQDGNNPGVPADPTPWPGQNFGNATTTFGSAGARVSNISNAQIGPNGNPNVAVSLSCTQSLCQGGERPGISCCANPIPNSINWTILVDPWRATHSGYCTWMCNGDEVQTVREKITGTGQGGTLPTGCGGPAPGGGQPQL